MIKRVNAYFSLASLALIAVHVIYEIFAYITMYYNPVLSALVSYIPATIIVTHAIISIICVIFLNDSIKILYKSMNRETVLQRVSAFLMVILLPVHIVSYNLLESSAGSAGYIVTEIAQVIFYMSLYTHIAVSVSKAFVTLGFLDDDRRRKRIDVFAMIICGIMFFITTVIILTSHGKMF